MNTNNKTFCVLPFKNLTTNNDGRVKLCCNVQTEHYVKNNRGGYANIHKDPLKDFWNSPALRRIRQDTAEGKPVEDCRYCYDMESRGCKSSRQWANEKLLDLKTKRIIRRSLQNKGFVETLPDSLELRISNTCNLRCHSCWSLSSSAISKERERWLEDPLLPEYFRKVFLHEKEITRFSVIQDMPQKSFFEESFDKISPNLKRLYLSGGEPSMIKPYLKILNRLTDIGNTHLSLSLTINLTHLPPRFLSLLKKFSRLEVSCSIDGYGKANDYIRYPSRWPVISKNLKILKENLPSANIVIYSVHSIYNSFSLIDLAGWLESEFASPPPLCLTWLRHPEQLRPENLPESLKKKALDKQRAFISGRSFKNPLTRSNIENLPRVLNTKADPLLFQKFLSWTRFSDKKRKLKLNDCIPELSF